MMVNIRVFKKTIIENNYNIFILPLYYGKIWNIDMPYFLREVLNLIKIFLVEDEVVVREGIRNTLNWEENDFKFCGEASDGELAYPLIQKHKPDIVITDIRMPFMDGLELSRLIKKEMPWIKIIILSGYGEFEYAKEAINIGVTEYLLKPINGTELMNCLLKVKEKILIEQKEKANIERFKKEMKEYEEDEKRRIFYDLVNNMQPLSNILERASELNLELSAMVYNIILFTIDHTREYNNNFDKIGAINQELKPLFQSNNDIIKFDLFMDGMALLLKGNSFDDLQRKQEYYINQLKDIMDAHQEVSYFGGIGIPVNRLGELSRSYHEARRAFSYRYIWEENLILDSSAISKTREFLRRTNRLNMNNIVKLDKRKAENFLKSGSKEDVGSFVEEYLQSICDENRNSILFRQYVVIDMYSIAAGFCKDLGACNYELKNPLHNDTLFRQTVSKFDYIKDYIKRIFENAIEIRDKIITSQYNDIVSKAKIYIQDNFCREDLSLNQVAASVFVTPSHFSSVFSQKTGQTFIKYLTDLRMNKAKELLLFTDMKTSEVGYAVGYKDPHYFSYLFKKTFDCSPKQFRNNFQKREDSL